jgi:hypothetical protein
MFTYAYTRLQVVVLQCDQAFPRRRKGEVQRKVKKMTMMIRKKRKPLEVKRVKIEKK